MVAVTAEDLSRIWNREARRAERDPLAVLASRGAALSRDITTGQFTGMANFWAEVVDLMRGTYRRRLASGATSRPVGYNRLRCTLCGRTWFSTVEDELGEGFVDAVCALCAKLPELVPVGAGLVDPRDEKPVPVPRVPDGTYTVVKSDGSYATIKLEVVSSGKLEGKRIVSYLSGPDNETDFTGFAFASGFNISVWRRFRGENTAQWVEAALTVLGHPARTEEFREAYAMRSGRCARCNRTLTVPASVNRGLGPECAKKLGG